MSSIKDEYYIENDYRPLAGPFSRHSKKEMGWAERVIEDMKRGGIDYNIQTDEFDEIWIHRRGMILPKRKPKSKNEPLS
jgi:hypothetical protein